MFSHPSQRRASEITSSYIALRTAARQLWEGLHEVLRVLLKNAQLRERVLQLLAAFVNDNALRSQMQVPASLLLPSQDGSTNPCSRCIARCRKRQSSARWTPKCSKTRNKLPLHVCQSDILLFWSGVFK